MQYSSTEMMYSANHEGNLYAYMLIWQNVRFSANVSENLPRFVLIEILSRVDHYARNMYLE